ncbi:sulfotransferase family protein [Salinibacter ruber]|uniref:Sulfotransferase n=1 Tax=Salinibacter ruber TaxID=146919 RepID=A0A9X2UBA0_9BACT|nr:sulfotransferase [Salinibacter ruber]MCS3953304.1 hypothetical protein [Salinibacter ruber]
MSSDSLQLFITGVYRTGSTYLSFLLNNHPDLTVGLHTTNWFREQHKTARDALHYAEKRWGIEYSEGDLPPQTECENEWDAAMRALFETHRWGEKQQLETSNIPTFLDQFPNGKAISIIRDPRSVLASWTKYTHHDPPAHLQAPFNSLGALQHTHRFAERLAPDRFRYVTYENLAQNTCGVVQRLIRWLELPWPGSEEMLSQDGWANVPGSQWEDRSSYDDPKDVDIEASVNRWRGNLSTQEVAFVEIVCGDEMEWFEYEWESEEEFSVDEAQELIRSHSKDPEQRERTLEMFNHWRRSGGGVEMFPDEDVTDEETWVENQ